MLTTLDTGLWRIRDRKLELNLHLGQTRAWNSKARFVFVLAGTQSGKTSWGPWWLEREIRRCGAGDYLAVTASFDLFKIKMLPALRETFEHILGIGRYWSGDRIIELADPRTGEFLAKRSVDPMWGRIILRSATAGGGLESATAKAAWLDECGQDEFTVETWEAVLRRLSLSQGRVLGTTTPYNLGWVKTEIYDRWTAGDPRYEVVQFHSSLNPAFPEEEEERARDTMPAWRYQMFYRGQFARPAGMIYDCFRENLHVVEPFPIPSNWPRYAGVDFGGANTAQLWLAHDLDAGRYFVWDATLGGGKSSKEHAAAARAHVEGLNFVRAWGGAKSEDQSRMDWEEGGFPIYAPAVWDVESGISRVYELLKKQQLYIFSTCRGVLDEIGSYRRKLDVSGQPTDEIENKRHFHRLDALRYVVAGLTGHDEEWDPFLSSGAVFAGAGMAGWGTKS